MQGKVLAKAREKAQENIAENRKAFHDYHILQTWDAGVVLLGTEVKGIREGRANLRDSFARVDQGEIRFSEFPRLGAPCRRSRPLASAFRVRA